MILNLTAVSLYDRPLKTALSARFDDHGGTIGRADHNTLALPDPDRFISRLQAEVVASGNRFLLRNVSSGNAMMVGARALQGGQSTVLENGDEIRIGGYVVRADYAPVVGPAAAAVQLGQRSGEQGSSEDRGLPPLRHSPPPAVQAQPVTGLSSSNPFADLLGPAGSPGPSQDPFADLFGPAQSPSQPPSQPPAARAPLPAYQPAPAGIDGRSAALPHAPPPQAYPRLPDDFDPFAPPPAPPAAGVNDATTDPFADLMAMAPGPGVDQAFGLADAARGDPLADFESALAKAPAAAGRSMLSTDPLELFGGSPAPPPTRVAGPAQPDHVPALHSAYMPPAVSVPPAAPAKPSPMPMPMPSAMPMPVHAPTATTAPPPATQRSAAAPAMTGHRPPAVGDDDSAQALWAAFCAGAGIELPLPPGSGAERMQTIGKLLRAAVDGTIQLMAVRASTKHEMRAAVTVIQPRNNNALKFSPDAATGVEQLLQPPARGFLDGPQALEEVMQDLVGHSIGTVAGMRAAIEGMLGRFDPAALEEKLSGGSVFDSLLPMNRRAKLWDLYVQHHARIREEAQEDFHALFGRAFLAAYEQQIERLRSKKHSR
ncbi:MAG TPA: type VI secretion system-associated FHA domain protein TagH [Rubrivivax sp.]|nr:type VI secretion system-associated FHA domain protein TagH [Rubrivivax sp.]